MMNLLNKAESLFLKYPESCGKFKIKSIRDLTTGFDSSQADLKAVCLTHSLLLNIREVNFMLVTFHVDSSCE